MHTANDRLNYRIFLDRSRPAEARKQAVASVLGPPSEEEALSAADIAWDREEEPELRVAALRKATSTADVSAERIDRILDILQDPIEARAVREAALTILQMLGFSSTVFKSKRPEYQAALRGVIEDPDPSLREQALEVLAQGKDDYALRRLIDGLRRPESALVEPATAIGLLGYDLHADQFPLLRQIVRSPPDTASKREAVRLLSADPGSEGLLGQVLRDRGEDPEVRRVSATALQSVAPREFERHARQIVMDIDDDEELRTTCMSALARSAKPGAQGRDGEFERSLEQIENAVDETPLKRAVRLYNARIGSK